MQRHAAFHATMRLAASLKDDKHMEGKMNKDVLKVLEELLKVAKESRDIAKEVETERGRRKLWKSRLTAFIFLFGFSLAMFGLGYLFGLQTP